jgi:nucleoside-diphosphate-sugar epimerase
VDGPVGVQSRNFSNDRIYTTGWKSRFSLEDGIRQTFPWVARQVRKARRKQKAVGTYPA